MVDKHDNYDYTSAQRAAKYLERLAKEKGKRLPVDLGAKQVEQISELIAAGYGSTAAAVIRKAIDDAHASLNGEKAYRAKDE